MTDQVRDAFAQLRADVPFWSLRWVEESSETLSVRQDVLEPVRLARERGAMLTVMIDGGYGYAATSDVSAPGLQAALDRAVHWARATRQHSVFAALPLAMPPAQRWQEELAPPEHHSRKVLLEMLAQECAQANIDKRIVDRSFALQRRSLHQYYLTNQAADIEQVHHFTLPQASVSANVGADTQTRSFEFHQRECRDTLQRSGFLGCGKRLAEAALQLVAAPNCPSGKMDLLLMPDQMMLQIHESIGHPLELDRILGDERNYAGTSFVTLDMFGSYRYGSPLLNVTYDPSVTQELASFAYDDDGSRAQKVFLIRDGILECPLGGRLSQLRAQRSDAVYTANSRACSWNRPPIDRMANLNVEPGSSSLAQMIAGIERGVLMRTNVSWSIDDSRNKFQFGCEWGQLIEQGRLTTVVKNPNYRGISANFWRSLKMVGDGDSFELHGTLYCGKGEPNQAIHVGHAAPACVFGDVDVFGGAG